MMIIYFKKNEKFLHGCLSVSLITILQNHNVIEHKKASVTKICHAIIIMIVTLVQTNKL